MSRRRLAWGAGALGLLAAGGLWAAAAAWGSSVSSVSVAVSPATAGQSATYTVTFTATSGLLAGSGTVTFNANGGEAGTVFPAAAASYVITDATHSSGSGTVSATPVRANGNAQVTFTVPKKITAGDVLHVAVSGVTSPPLASSSQTMAVSTSADTTAVNSAAYSLTTSADGSGTLTASPTSVPRASGTTLIFTYTAAAGGTSGGLVSVTAPAGWSSPSTTAGTAGYTTASTGTVSVSGQTVTVSAITLASNATMTITYGSGGASAAAVAPNTAGANTFTAKEASTSAGTLTSLAASPTVTTTYAPDGSGTMAVNPGSVPRSRATTLTFTYTAAAGGTSGGKITLTSPTGWTAPSATSGTAGYTTSNAGTISVSAQTVTVSGLNLNGGDVVTVTYGAGGGANAATAPATTGSATFTTAEQSTSTGTLTNLATQPAVTVTYAPDGSGVMSVTPTSVPAGAQTTLTFTYTAAAGGTSNGQVTVVVPTGWTPPSTTAGAAGYTTASSGTVSVSGQTITVAGVTLNAAATLTVTYGSGGGANAATATTTITTGTFAAQEASTSTGTLIGLASSPTVATTTAPDGSGTITVNPTSVTAYSPTTLTYTYTAATGGISGGAVQISVPYSWTAPTATSGQPGYTTSSAGVLVMSGNTITVSSLTLTAGSTLTVTYGSGGGANAATDQSMTPASQFQTSEQSTPGGTATPLAASPLATVTQPTVAISPGAVSTFAGSGSNTNVDGTGTAASVASPNGMVVVGGNGYVAASNEIRKVNLASGQVTTLAGTGASVCTNATTGASSSFYSVSDLATDGYYLYTTDTCNPPQFPSNTTQIRRVSLATGATSTVATLGPPATVVHLTVGPDGAVYADAAQYNTSASVWRVDPVNGTVTTVANFTPAPNYNIVMGAITADASGVYVADAPAGDFQIDKIAVPGYALTTVVGTGNGIGTGALTSAGNYLYAATSPVINQVSYFNGGVGRFDKSTGAAAVVGGSSYGYTDGVGLGAQFNTVSGLSSNGTTLFVADAGNRRLRVINAGPSGALITAAELNGGGDNPAKWCDQCWNGKTKRSMQMTPSPVTPATGNFWHTFDDVGVPGRGLPLDFSRTYNSTQAGVNGPLGYGWSYSYGLSLSIGAQSVTVNQGSGAQAGFVPDGHGGWAPNAPRILAGLTHNGDGTWRLSLHSRIAYTFDSNGRLTGEQDLNGYTTTVAYPNGSTMVVTDPAGRTLTMSLTGGLITQVTDSASPARTVQFQYNDGQGNLTDVIDVAGGHWTFTYDAGHRLLTMRSPKYFGDSTTSPSPVVTNHYDASGWVDWQSDQDGRTTSFDYTGYDRSGLNGVVKTTDPSGSIDAQSYADGQLTVDTTGYNTLIAATTKYAYDPTVGGATQITDPDGHSSNRYFDPATGNLLSEVDALGRTTRYSYDELNDPTSVTDPAGTTTTMVYDRAGNLQSASTPLAGSSPAQTRTTTYTYGDSSHPGDVTGVTDPDSKITTMAYDAYGDLTSVTDPAGNHTTYSYNTGTGWRTSMVAPNGNVAGGNPAAHTTSYAHNNYGQLLTATDPLGHVQVNNTYDADGHVATSTDADNHQTSYSYDPAGQLTTVTRADTTTLTYSYDTDGNQTAQTDGNHQSTGYGYTNPAYPHAVTSTTDPDSRTTSYAYDPAGNQVTKQDPGGNCAATPKTGCTTVGYDPANQPTRITYSDGATPNVSFTYDSLGRRHTMADGTGTSTWNYDSLGRLTSEQNGAGATVAYGYDLKGQLTAITYPGGTNTVARGYDDAGRLTTVTDWNNHQSVFGYDADSNLTTQTYPNGTTATYTPDAADRLMAIADAPTASPNSPFATFTYNRDAANQLSSSVATGVPTENNTYTYSALNQLQGVNTTSYGYDSADNLTTLTSGATQASTRPTSCAGNHPQAQPAPAPARPPTPPPTATTPGVAARAKHHTVARRQTSPTTKPTASLPTAPPPPTPTTAPDSGPPKPSAEPRPTRPGTTRKDSRFSSSTGPPATCTDQRTCRSNKSQAVPSTTTMTNRAAPES